MKWKHRVLTRTKTTVPLSLLAPPVARALAVAVAVVGVLEAPWTRAERGGRLGR